MLTIVLGSHILAGADDNPVVLGGMVRVSENLCEPSAWCLLTMRIVEDGEYKPQYR